MFRHKGKSRTYLHNIKLASLLSFVAGMVNITGVLSIKILTTNVTGHFAFFSEEFFKENYFVAFSFLFYIFSFLAGSFTSNWLIEKLSKTKPWLAYDLPMLLEVTLLICTGVSGFYFLSGEMEMEQMACILLFAMGLQNSLVTKVSASVVRTTHLTGLFTDLGIELSQLFFYKTMVEKKQLGKSIYLKLAIIGFFFTGCITGAWFYKHYSLYVLCIAAVFLIAGLLYDHLRFRYYYMKRKAH
jgi:uncharacterized membrane protein YoaK (UPF0700 family)